MNDTHKLLLAICEALDLDVETTTRIIQTPENLLVKSMLVTDYKVTKKKENVTMVPLPINSEAFGCLVNYLMSHKDDIESGVNDFGDLKPIWEFANRNCP